MAFAVIKIYIAQVFTHWLSCIITVFQLACVLLVQCEVCQYGLHYFSYYASTEGSFWSKKKRLH